jgi:hypothetical protein
MLAPTTAVGAVSIVPAVWRRAFSDLRTREIGDAIAPLAVRIEASTETSVLQGPARSSARLR